MAQDADMLFLLASLCVRTNLLVKAEFYGKVGSQLFPDDLRIKEIYAYACYLRGNTEGASEVLATVEAQTPNLELLRARVAMTTGLAKEIQQRHIRAYLAN